MHSSFEKTGRPSREECINQYWVNLSAFLAKMKKLCENHGLFSTAVDEHVDTCIPDMREWNDVVSVPQDTLVQAFDEAMDGYIVRKRVPIQTIRNAWVFHVVGPSLYVTWIDDRGWSSILFHDHMLMESPCNDVFWEAIEAYGVWPLKVGYLPEPSKNRLLDEA